jgi:hypothetical protein
MSCRLPRGRRARRGSRCASRGPSAAPPAPGSRRHPRASHPERPRPTAGSISSGSSSVAVASRRPRRRSRPRPAAASYRPVAASGGARPHFANGHGGDVGAPGEELDAPPEARGAHARPAGSVHRGRSRPNCGRSRILAAGNAARTRSRGRSPGRSFRLWTARSTRPSRSASSISWTKRPLPPTSARCAVASRSPRFDRHELDLATRAGDRPRSPRLAERQLVPARRYGHGDSPGLDLDPSAAASALPPPRRGPGVCRRDEPAASRNGQRPEADAPEG